MIYLIDDKKTRQKDFGWTEEKFAKFASCLMPLYTIEEVVSVGENLYDGENIILYHESFLDFTENRDKAVDQRNKLLAMAATNKGLSVAFFSGSQGARSLSDNIAHLPVSILYENLEIFINEFGQGTMHLKYLLFGENPEIEAELNEIVTGAIKVAGTNAAIISGCNLFIRPTSRYIQNAIADATEAILFNDVSDEKLSEKVNEWLKQRKYNAIFLPLCFGNILSDFNGLRLASHIRCTKTINQTSRIFIYGFVGLEYIIDDKYFNILRTKNVSLIPFLKTAFQQFGNKNEKPLTQDELVNELSKLKLDVPGNYFDSHHVANEWGIYQMARNAGLQMEDIEGFEYSKLSSIYFKWLIAKNNLYEELPDDQIEHQKEYSLKLPGLNIKGKIDLDRISKR